MNWEEYSFVVRSKERKRIFLLLVRPKTPSEISRELSKKAPQVSRTLKQFSEKGLIECKTPSNKIGRVYILTKKGKKLLEYFKEKE